MNVLDFNTTMFLNAYAWNYRRRGYEVFFWPFWYGADWLPLVNAATTDQFITIEKDAEFIWTATMFTAFNAAGANLNAPNITLEWTFGASQRTFQNVPAHLMNVAGTAARPFYLYRPVVFPPRTTLQARLVNMTSADANVRISIHGVKAILQKAA